MSALTILDLVSDELDDAPASADEQKEDKAKELRDLDMLELAYHEFKNAKNPRDGIEALRLLVDLSK